MKRLLPVLLILLLHITAHANHLVGGDISYRCIGGGQFEITLNVYRDANSGGALLDDPAIIAIINRDNNSVTYRNVSLSNTRTVPNNSLGPCVTNPPTVNIQQGTYKTTVSLSSNSNGYSIVYQRCCRNENILNLSAPETQGSTYETFISPAAILNCNSQPQFTNFPPTVICINSELDFDHSATDANGDSLVYALCPPLKGLNQSTPALDPANGVNVALPPYQSVNFLNPFTFSNPIASNPPISINPLTGQLKLTPTQEGRFAVGICVSEYRNGVLISKYIRDFQFTVFNCNATTASINVPNATVVTSTTTQTYYNFCEGLTVNFENKSTRNLTNFWDFGVAGITNDTSVQVSPSYLYQDTGIYKVTLIINKGQVCADTTSVLVYIRPILNAGFYHQNSCAQQTILFFDTSSTVTNDISSWTWTFGNGAGSSIQNPTTTYANNGTFPVTLAITTTRGCKKNVTKNITIDPKPDAKSDNTRVCLNLPITLKNLSTISSGNIVQNLWNNINIFEPTYTFNTSGTKNVTLEVVSDKGCRDTTIVQIDVQDSLVASFQASALSACSGVPIDFTNTSVGSINNYIWDFGDGTTDNSPDVSHTYNSGGTYPVKLTITNTLCGSTDVSKQLQITQTPFVNLPDEVKTCIGQLKSITVLDSIGTKIIWSTGSTKPTIWVDASISSASVTVERQGCFAKDSVTITPKCEFYIPTAFSPNDDNINDVFNVIADNVISYQLRIFNRWGQEIFTTDQFAKGWDGSFNGKPQPVDSYIYYIEGVLFGGEQFKKSGIFSLIK